VAVAGTDETVAGTVVAVEAAVVPAAVPELPLPPHATPAIDVRRAATKTRARCSTAGW